MILGCGGGGTSGGTRSFIRLVNTIPDLSGNLELLVNAERFGEPIGYLAEDTFRTRAAEDVDLAIREVGAVEEFDVVANLLANDASYLAVALGSKNFGTETEKRPRLEMLRIDRTRPSGSKARVIFLNALIGEATFPSPTIDFQDGELPRFPFTDVEFGAVKTLVVDIGTYTYEARLNDSDFIYSTRDLTFESGKFYLVTLAGTVGTSGATAPQIAVTELESQ